MYKDSVVHCYYINQRAAKDNKRGWRYFSKPDSFRNYFAKAEEIEREMRRTEKVFKNCDLKLLSDKVFRQKYEELLTLIGRFSEVYVRTEAEKMKKFEGISDSEIKRALFKIGKMRLKLRKSVEAIFHVFLGKVLKEIVRRFGVKANDWFFYDHQDTQNLFRYKLVSPKVIAQRQKGYALIKLNGRNELLVGNDFRKAWQLVKSLTRASKKELQGQTAYPGVVKGRVELIRHNTRSLTDKVKRFKKGNILVTEMTTPATIIACKKASAIITDEGGVLCHAAIISREFKKPCIVGTKQATQTLKDGDLIEVDATRGIVVVE